MGQRNEFNVDDLAPESWVRGVEGNRAGAAIWRDGSWGNNAAPSWELAVPDGNVHAEAFYYTPSNAERFVTRFGGAAYVSLTLYQDESITAACVMEPDAFLDVVRSATSANCDDPIECLQHALQSDGLSHRIVWERVESTPGAADE